MHRSIIKHQNGRLFDIFEEIINRSEQKLRIDVRPCLISHRDIVATEDAEQIHFLVSLRKDSDLLTFRLPGARQTRMHRKTGFVAEIQIDLIGSRQLRQNL